MSHATGKHYDLPDHVCDEIVELYLGGKFSLQQIANLYKISRGKVRYTLTQRGYSYRVRRRGDIIAPASGERHHNWKGGRAVGGGGYILVRISDDHPYASMAQRGEYGLYIVESRLAMATALGRCLLPSETVHHIDGDIKNNDLSNLQLRQGQHGPGQAYVCGSCGSSNIVATPLDGSLDSLGASREDYSSFHKVKKGYLGKRIDKRGYVYVRMAADHPFAETMRSKNGDVPEHRLVVAESLGRPLLFFETVHHINGDRANNSIENLQLRSNHHGKGHTRKCQDCQSLNVVATKLGE